MLCQCFFKNQTVMDGCNCLFCPYDFYYPFQLKLFSLCVCFSGMWDSRIRLAKRPHFVDEPDFRSILPLLPNDYENEYEGALTQMHFNMLHLLAHMT